MVHDELTRKKTYLTDTPLDRFRRPLRDLRISVTDRCNFRCPYCMPAEIYGERYKFLPRDSLLTFEEITRLARILVKMGVVKVRITGGEPLVRAEIDKLVAMLAEVPGVEDLTMTTNGYLLAQFAQKLADAGLQRITVSLDSLDDEVFRQMNGRNFGTERVLRGIEAAERAGFDRSRLTPSSRGESTTIRSWTSPDSRSIAAMSSASSSTWTWVR